VACLGRRQTGRDDITERERIDDVDIIRAIRRATGARARSVHRPYRFFWALLGLCGVAQSDPPFTTRQLRALTTPDQFLLIALFWTVCRSSGFTILFAFSFAAVDRN
jgi:hypothetical protein